MLLRTFWLVLLVMSVTGGIAHAQGRTVTGKVQEDVAQAPIPGATVTVKGTDLGAITDADGVFTIENAPADALVLQISGPGYEDRELAVAIDQQEVAVSLAPATSEEIIIVGRAPQIIRQNLANGASVVKGEEITEVSAQTVDDALQGRISGANIQSNSGAPGGGIQVKLRGISTINGEASPLFVIDGVIISNASLPSNIGSVTESAGGSNPINQDNAVNRIADLNPNDIENIEVLKGPAAAALYGSKATNGVVIITTKRGRRGPPVVEVLQRFGTYTLSNKLGSRKFETMAEAIDVFGDNAAVISAYGTGRTVDHEELLAGRERMAAETFANLSGGTDTTSYYASLLTRNDPGIIANTGYQKQSLRLNVDQRLGERLKIAVSSNLIRSEASRSVTNNDNAILSHYMTLPFTPNFFDPRPYDDGSYPCNPFAPGSANNPLQTSRLMSDSEETWRFIGSTAANVEVWSTPEHAVNVGATLGLDRFQQTNSILFPSELCFTAPDGAKGIALEGTTEVRNMNFGVSGVYNLRPANGAFQAATTLGVQYEDSDARGLTVEGRRLNPGSENVHAAQQVNVREARAQVRDQGMHLQQEFKLLEDRLTLLAALLAERSSANGDANRLFFYPKAATTYNIAVPVQEIELLRARLAYGETGNKPPSTFKFTPLSADENIGGSPGLVPGGVAGDADIRPERQREIELGIDAVGLDGRVVAELTVYQRSISDLILERTAAPSTGYILEYLNGGAMRNRGVELMLQGTPVRINEVSWLSRAIFSLNRSQITDLDVPAFNVRVFGTALGEFRIEEGESATQIVGNVTRNGVTTVEKLGDAEPTFRMSFVNNVTYGDFALSTLLDWQQGSQIINVTKFIYDSAANTADFETAGMARVAAAAAGNTAPYIDDATFLKVREIALSYKLPDELIGQLGPMDHAHVSVSGRNLLTFTTYPGLDPEVSNFGARTVNRNVDVAPFPPSRSFWISIEAGF
jgi:TonB-linked SusC/RagA family outer membrane protein